MKKTKQDKPQAPWIFDPNFKYIPSSKTNIVETFKRLGWVPPSEVQK